MCVPFSVCGVGDLMGWDNVAAGWWRELEGVEKGGDCGKAGKGGLNITYDAHIRDCLFLLVGC